MNNSDKRLTYVLLKINYTKIYIFTNGLFVNNKNLSFQLEFMIVLVIKMNRTEHLLSYLPYLYDQMVRRKPFIKGIKKKNDTIYKIKRGSFFIR